MESVIPSIKDLIKNNQVWFDHFRANYFYYNIIQKSLDDSMKIGDWYQFPVPLEDIGDATLKLNDKAIYFMRYIRRAIADKTFVKI